MSGSQTFERISRATLEEHRQIHFYLDQIGQTLTLFKKGLQDVEPMRRLAAQLEGLKERLVEHHHSEESGGLFQAILEALPSCRVEVDRLTNQHSRIIEILEIARLHAALGEFLEGRTTLIVAHRLSAVKQADHVYVFEAGRITEQGAHEDLIRGGGLYSTLYGDYQTA